MSKITSDSFLNKSAISNFKFYSIFLLFILFWQNNFGQATLPFYDGLNYTTGSQLVAPGTGWVLNSAAAAVGDMPIVAGSLSYSGLSASVGGKTSIAAGGDDAIRNFTTTNSGKIYYSFLMNVTSVTGFTSGYFVGLLPSASVTAGIAAPFTAPGSGAIGATSWVKASANAGFYNIGFSGRANQTATTSLPTTLTYSATDYPVGSTVLVVVSYEIVAGSSNDICKLWINPTPGSTEPVAAFTANPTTDLIDLAGLFVKQNGTTSTPGVDLDEFRIGTTWADVTPAAAVLQSQTITFGSLSPVTVGASNFTLTATASSGLPVSYSSSNPLVATVDANGVVTIVGVGTTSITASQSGNSSYSPAVSVSQNLVVNCQTITPSFSTIAPICSGSTAPVLATTSNEGIVGTWSPATIDNTTSGSYTFTPNSGQCATSTSISVTVNSPVTPSFSTIAPICSGSTAPVLATTSTDGIAGTWSPAVVDNTTSGTYTFTPTAGQCATTTTLSVTVTTLVTPTFNAIAPICSGSTSPVLATTSNEGIAGTWSPSTISNTASGTYTFTPTAGQCATTASLSVTVNPIVTPSFTFITSICAGSTAPVLPTSSTNGITGTWSPSVIDNTTSGTYTFTSDAGQCANSTNINVTVNTPVTPTFQTFAPIYAGNTAPILPLTSINGYTGTWSPSTISNTASGTYTFTPNAGQCASTATVNITVNTSGLLYFYDGLNYTVGQSLTTQTGWVLNSTATNDMLITAGSLNYSGLAPSTGNKVAFASGGEDAIRAFTASTGTVYYSYLLNVTDVSTASGYVAGLIPSASASSTAAPGSGSIAAPIWVKASTNAGYFNVGFSARANQAAQYGTVDYPLNTPIFVVASYQPQSGVGNDVYKLWVNPTPGAPEPNYTFTSISTTDLADVGGFFIRQNGTSSTPGVEMDEIRVGTTWPDVTPPAISQTITFGPLTAVTMGASNFTLTATASSGLPVTYTSSNPLVATVDANGVVTVVGVGTTVITASQAGNSVYSAATSVNQNLVVNCLMVTPSFNAIAPICSGDTAPVLATTSTDGIAGTWSPAVVDNTTSGTYTFTPNAGQCANSTTISVTVNAPVTPSFNSIAAFCSGSTAPTLATTSTNGISGTWSPATIDNTTSGSYTFTPNSGQCANNATISVTVNSPVTPSFSAIAPICSGSTAPVLATTSTDGIAGTWSPAVVDNTTSGTYTFTPAAGQCATTTTLSVTVTTLVTPTFNAIAPICSGSTSPVLATTSNEGIAGTWSPSTISNTASGTYTFTPTAGQCATPASLSVTVNPIVTPSFTFITSICAGSTAPVLPTSSTNGITGTWSPSVIDNTTSGTYTFTPDAGQCANSTNINVTVNTPVTPTFQPIAPIYAGNTAPNLPLTSINGFAGTWSPSTISNTASGTYTFTANAGQCATTTSMNITVNATGALLFYDGLNYTVGQSLTTQTGWVLNSTATNDMLITAGSLNYSGLAPSTGNKVAFASGGEDAIRPFTATTGTVYYSYLLNVTDVSTATGYVAGMITSTAAAGTGAPGSGSIAAPIWVKASANAGYFNVGFSARANQTAQYGTVDYPINTPIFVVASYQPQSGVSNDVYKLWVNPSPGAPEPNYTFTSISTSDLADVGGFFIKQNGTSSTPGVEMDEIRVGYTWPDVTPAAAIAQTITFGPLSAVTVGASNFTLTATASSGLPVTYTSSNPLVATVNPNGVVTIVGVGTTVITASQAGNSVYSAATSVNQNLVVNCLMVTPSFNAIAPICSGDTAPVLATTSTDGIAGTWSPAVVDNTTSGTYTFTPNAGQCANSTTISVTINTPVTPTFTQIGPINQGTTAPILPSVSNDGITGTWSPAVVDTTTSGTYTFTPNAGQCATTSSMNIVVIGLGTDSFNNNQEITLLTGKNYLSITNVTKYSKIEIFAVTGAIVKSFEISSDVTTDLTTGFYIVKITNSDQVQSFKILVK